VKTPRRLPAPEAPPVADAPVRAEHVRDHVTALANALHLIRLTAGNDQWVLAALDLADRQLAALMILATAVPDPFQEPDTHRVGGAGVADGWREEGKG
jgi:hypothetical protein